MTSIFNPRILTFFLIFTFSSITSIYSQTLTIQNSVIFGGSAYDQPINYIQTSDGGLIVLAISNSNNGDLTGLVPAGSTTTNVIAIKYSSLLVLEWKKLYSDFQSAGPITTTQDNHFAFIARGRGLNDGYFVKINSTDGELMTQTSLPRAIYNTKFITLSNGNFVSASTISTSSVVGFEDNKDEIEVLYMDNNGQTLWLKLFGGYGDEKAVDVFEDDNKIMVFGRTKSNDKDVVGHRLANNKAIYEDIWMFKLNPTDGNILFQKCYGGSGYESLYSVKKCNNGDYLLHTLYDSIDFDIETNYNNCCFKGLFRINNSGETVWQQLSGMTESATILEEIDGSILLTNGSTFKKFSPLGVELWTQYSSTFYTDLSSPFTLISPSQNDFFALATKSNVSTTYLSNNIYLAKFTRSKLPLAIKEISKSWLCQNTSFNVSIETDQFFDAGNQFRVILNRNGTETVIGTSNNLTTISATSPIVNAGTTTNFAIKVVSTNPVFSSNWHSIKVQSSEIPTPILPTSIYRGESVNIRINFNNGDNGPHSILINNKWYNTMTRWVDYYETIGKTKTYNITAYKDLCGTYPFNFSQSIQVNEKVRADLQTPPQNQWDKTFGGSRDEVFLDLIKSNDNNFLVSGSSNSKDLDFNNLKGQEDAWITKIDENGNKLWAKNFGGNGTDKLLKIRNTSDGGYIAAGLSTSTTDDLIGYDEFTRGWVLKMDANGSKQWTKKYGIIRQSTVYPEELEDIIETSDGGFVLVGIIDNYFGIRKIDALGNEVWLRKIGTDGGGRAYSVDKDIDGNLFISGVCTNYPSTYNGGYYDILFAKLAPDGSIIQTRNYGGSGLDFARQIKHTTDGGFILTGYTQSTNGIFSNSKGYDDVFVLKTNSNGDITWSKQFGTSSNDFGYSIEEVSDGYLIGANSSAVNSGDLLNTSFYDDDAWILKIDKLGLLKWQKLLGGSNGEGWSFGAKVVIANNGDYVLATNKNSGDGDASDKHGYSDLWIVRLNNIPACESIVSVVNPVNSVQIYKANQKIIGTNKIENGGNVIFSAKKVIELNAGFESKTGSVFKTEMIGCEN